MKYILMSERTHITKNLVDTYLSPETLLTQGTTDEFEVLIVVINICLLF